VSSARHHHHEAGLVLLRTPPGRLDRTRSAPAVGDGATPRAVVFFAGARDHYQLPLALAERDWLESFITEIYWPMEHRRLGPVFRGALPRRMHSLRHQDGLSSSRVRISWRGLAANAAMMAFPKWKLFSMSDRWLGEKGRRVAARTGAAILSYSYYVHSAFRPGCDRPRYRFIFQLHPHPRSVRRILEEEVERCPWAAASLQQEEELRPDARRFEQLCEEPTLANGWIAASEFTAQTLAENGIPRDQIHVVPYGIDPIGFPRRQRPRRSDEPLEILFIGSMIQRKGLSDLLEAVRRMPSRHVRLTLAGRGFVDRKLLEHYSDVTFSVRHAPNQTELVRLMHQSDLFVLPSLVEGFGHVVAEAMCSGLPVIATPHTCAADLVRENREGWLVPIRSPEAIANRLGWALDHRNDLIDMGEAAAERARTLTWTRFRQGIALAYQAMVRGVAEAG
jgi:glycosyltransferase involved in cell wall biosynthesis